MPRRTYVDFCPARHRGLSSTAVPALFRYVGMLECICNGNGLMSCHHGPMQAAAPRASWRIQLWPCHHGFLDSKHHSSGVHGHTWPMNKLLI